MEHMEILKESLIDRLWHDFALPTHTFNFLYKMWGKFCFYNCMVRVATEHFQRTGLGWRGAGWQLTTVSANKRRAKFLKECVNQWHAACTILSLGGQHWVTDFEKCARCGCLAAPSAARAFIATRSCPSTGGAGVPTFFSSLVHKSRCPIKYAQDDTIAVH